MRRGGFTLIELLVVITIISLLISILMPSLGKAREAARQLKDSTHLRTLVQGMVIWAGSNQDEYPRPSRVDPADMTTQEGGLPPLVKDNTGNILSLLIFNGFLFPQQAVCPAEINPQVTIDREYEYSWPRAAFDPPQATWDPGFAGVPAEFPPAYSTGLGISPLGGRGRRTFQGNNSYANLMPFAGRMNAWQSTFSSSQAVWANRGPNYMGQPGAWQLAPGPGGVDSNRLKIFGLVNRWEGNVAYNDGRVAFETQPDPRALIKTYSAAISGSRTHGDNMFVNEDDDTGIPLRPDNAPSIGTNILMKAYGGVFAGSGGVIVVTVWDD